jgi:hypothetical protein
MAASRVVAFQRVFDARLKSGRYEPIDVVEAVHALLSRDEVVAALDVYCTRFDPARPPATRNRVELCRTTGYTLLKQALALAGPANDLATALRAVTSVPPVPPPSERHATYRRRFEALDGRDRDELRRLTQKLVSDAAADAARRRTLLDALEQDFRDHTGRGPRGPELLAYTPGPPDGRLTFERVAVACDAAWKPRARNASGVWVMGQFVRTPPGAGAPTPTATAAMEHVDAAFASFHSFVDAQLKQPLDLFRLLAWAREPSGLYATVSTAGGRTTRRDPTSGWSSVWKELYLDIAARGLALAVARWNVLGIQQARNYAGRDLEFILAPLSEPDRTWLLRALKASFESVRQFSDQQSQRRQATVWGEVRNLELVDELAAEALIKEMVAEYRADPRDVLSRKVRLASARDVTRQTYHVNETAEGVFTVLWIPRQRGASVLYVEVHAFPGMVFRAYADRVGLVELIEEHLYRTLAANAAALTQFLLFYVQILGYALDVISFGATGGVRAVLFKFIELRLKEAIVNEGLDLAGIDNPWIRTVALIGTGMTPSAIKTPAVGALRLPAELEAEAQAATRGTTHGRPSTTPEPAPREAPPRESAPSGAPAEEPRAGRSGEGARPTARAAANDNLPVAQAGHPTTAAPPPEGATRGLRERPPVPYSDVTARRVAGIRREVAETAHRAGDVDRAAEHELAAAAGGESGPTRLTDERYVGAEQRGAAGNDNSVRGSADRGTPPQRPVTRRPLQQSRRSVNQGASRRIGRGTPADDARVQATVRGGHHVYLYHDARGNLLYVGKSGGVLGHHDWIQRLNESHMMSAWIEDARSVTVYYNLTEQEMWALEEVLIGRDPTGAVGADLGHALYNQMPGEYTRRFGEMGLGANAESALNRPVARFSFRADTTPGARGR